MGTGFGHTLAQMTTLATADGGHVVCGQIIGQDGIAQMIFAPDKTLTTSQTVTTTQITTLTHATMDDTPFVLTASDDGSGVTSAPPVPPVAIHHSA